MLGTLTAASFSPHLHSVFQVYPDDSQAVQLELVQVNERASSPRQVQFTILFRGPVDPLLPQRMYRVEHTGMGALGDLFLTPVGHEPDGFRYEAVFNRLID